LGMGRWGCPARSLLKLADPVRVVVSAGAGLGALVWWEASRREGWAVVAVTRWGVPATVARAGRVWW
jgi:hypothetical protein